MAGHNHFAPPRPSNFMTVNFEPYWIVLFLELDQFKWSGQNSFFVRCDRETLVFGSSDGSYGIWIEGTLLRGTSRKCKTFDSPVLTKERDFEVSKRRWFSNGTPSHLMSFFINYLRTNTVWNSGENTIASFDLVLFLGKYNSKKLKAARGSVWNSFERSN